MPSIKHNTYLPGYRTVAHHEWRTVENSAPHLLPPLEALVTKYPNLKLLDVGAGSGTITASIVKYMPSGHITAVDLSPEIVSRASVHAKEVGVASNITFQAASVYELSQTFGENAFDVVHASQMLCHLDSPVEALTEMLRVVKPGGVLALREIDMRVWSCYPDTEIMRAFHRVQLATHEAAGGSNAAGPSLVSWAMKAGAKREDIEASMGAWMYSTPEEREVWGATFRDRIRSGEMRKKALELGVATEAELDEMGEEWQRWIDTEDATCGTIHGQLLVTKA